MNRTFRYAMRTIPVTAACLLAVAILATPKSAPMAQVDPATLEGGWLGVGIRDDEQPGVYVNMVMPDSPAAACGLERGMRVLAINGNPVRETAEMIGEVGANPAGSTVVVRVAGGPDGAPERDLHAILTVRPSSTADFGRAMVGRPFPEIQAAMVQSGDRATVAPADGKVRVVEYWATWCGPCNAAVPTLNAMNAELPSDRFELVAVANEEREVVAPFVDVHEVTYRTMVDPSGEANAALWVMALPTYFVVDTSNTIVGFYSGGGELAAMRTHVERLLSAPTEQLEPAE